MINDVILTLSAAKQEESLYFVFACDAALRPCAKNLHLKFLTETVASSRQTASR